MSRNYTHYPTPDDIPDEPYTVVYDAEYTGFRPFSRKHNYERTGQTVSVFSPELQRDDFFAIRELRTYELDSSGVGVRESAITVLSKDEFSDLVDSDFDIDFTGGRSIGTAYYNVDRSDGCYFGKILGQWPAQDEGYAEAVMRAIIGANDFDFGVGTVFKAENLYSKAMRHVDLNPGPMRGTLITPDDIRDDLMADSPWVLYTHDFYSALSSAQSEACSARVREHAQVREDNPSSFLDFLWPNVCPVEIVPWTETLESVSAVDSVTPEVSETPSTPETSTPATPDDVFVELVNNGIGPQPGDIVIPLHRDRSFE